MADVRSGLELPGAVRARAERSGPPQVVFAAPSGPTSTDVEIALVFDQPMRALGLEPDQPSLPIVIIPGIEGRWEWVGSKALRFVAAEPLQAATAYTVEVPPGVRSLAGQALGEHFRFAFSTPRPKLHASTPSDHSTYVKRDVPIALEFSLPVAVAEVQRRVILRADGHAAPLAFTAERPAGDDEHRVVLRPAELLAPSTTIRVHIARELRSTVGPLSLDQAVEISFATAGPFRVVDSRCAIDPANPRSCTVGSPIELRLTSAVDSDLLQQALSIKPAVDVWIGGGGQDDDGLFSYTIHADFEPQHSYTLQLQTQGPRGALIDDTGQRLAQAHRHAFRFGDRSPSLQMGGRGEYWPAHHSLVMYPSAVNVENIEIRGALLSPEQVLERLSRGSNDSPAAVSFQGAKLLATPKRNEQAEMPVALRTLLGPKARGAVLLRADYEVPARGAQARAQRHRELQLQITDLGIVSAASHEHVHVWVTSLDTSEPVAAAQVKIRRPERPDEIVARGRTNRHGLARLRLPPDLAPERGASSHRRSASERPRLVVFVSTDDDRAHQVVRVQPRPGNVGLLYNDRGLYRPGETVHIKGIFRLASALGLRTPAGKRVTLVVTGPGDKEIRRFTPELSPFGTTNRALLLPDDAPLGRYHVRAELDGLVARMRFRVEEYAPTEFTVDASTDRAVYMRGDPLECEASGSYLHGGPMAGAGVRLRLVRGSARPDIKTLRGYDVTDESMPEPPHDVALSRGKFDASGTRRLRRRLALPGMRGAEQVSCEIYASDLDSRTLSERTSALVHRAEIYVGLKRQERRVHVGERFTTRVLAANLQRQRVRVPVQVQLIRRSTEADRDRTRDEVLARCQVKTGPEPVTCEFEAPEGEYGWRSHFRQELIVRATTTDPKGRAVSSSYSFAPRPPPPPAPERVAPPPTPPTKPSKRFKLVYPVRQSLEPGEQLQVGLESPWSKSAQVLLTAQREDVLWQRQVSLPPGGTTLSVPISQAMIPNVQLRALAVQGGDTEQDWGFSEVSADSRELRVELGVSKMLARPGESIELDVLVQDHRGAPVRAEVALHGADEGTLYLARYRAPQPWERLFSERSGNVDWENARDHLFSPWRVRHRARPPRVRMGATSAGDPPRADFRQTVLFVPALTTDANGRVRHKVRLPDGLTTYRFFAVAVAADDRFGAAEQEVVTRKPLMVRAKLPEVVRVGDRFRLTAIVQAAGPPPGSARPLPRGARARGFRLAAKPASRIRAQVSLAASGLTVHGPSELPVVLHGDAPARVEFEVSARKAGALEVVLRAQGPQAASDAVVHRGRVEVPTLIESAALYGDTGQPVAEALGDLSSLRHDVGELTVSLAHTRLVGLDAGIEQLLEYPYGCTEQTASRLLPLASLRSLAQATGAALPEAAHHRLRDAVLRLHSHQQADGGFGAWPRSGRSEPWITAYALTALIGAQQAGASVPSTVLPGAVDYLQRFVRTEAIVSLQQGSGPGGAHRGRFGSNLVAAAFAVDALASLGLPEPAALAQLAAQRDRLPPSAKALLLHAAVLMPARDALLLQQLEQDLTRAVRLDGDAATVVSPVLGAVRWDGSIMASQIRATALTLRALVATSPDHPLVGKLASGLLAGRRDGRWHNTQETAWALLALDEYRRRLPQVRRSFEARAFLGDELVGQFAFRPDGPLQQSFRVPLSKLANGNRKLTFDVLGSGEAHYQARLRFARRRLPTKARHAGLSVYKTMRRSVEYDPRPAPSAPSTTTFRPGQLIRVDVQVVTTGPRHFVVVDDPLPGGLQAVDPALRTGLHESWQRPWDRRELREDRVLFFVDHLPAGIRTFTYWARARTPGTYVLPPTQAHEMYAPEVRGATGSSKVRVLRR